MNRKITVLFCSTLLFLGGCSKKNQSVSSNAAEKPKASEKTSEKPSESPETTAEAESTAPARTAVPEKTAAPVKSTVPQTTQQPVQNTVTGTYQIISYDNGSGQKQTFTPGKDSSIIGSSSIVLKEDGSCEFNLPGMNSNGCKWSDNQIDTGGAQVTYSLNGNEMTVNSAGGTYVFQKTQ